LGGVGEVGEKERMEGNECKMNFTAGGLTMKRDTHHFSSIPTAERGRKERMEVKIHPAKERRKHKQIVKQTKTSPFNDKGREENKRKR